VISFNRLKASLSVFILILFIVSVVTPSSGSMGTFLDQVTSQVGNLAPHAYQGQERGYYMGGTMSVRLPNETIQPFSFTPPKVTAGCGGIDIVSGGFSYLGFQYLVDKLQSIMSAAPAFAFQIALGALCPDCKNVLDSLEAIADMINGLNINSCNASKAIGGYVGAEVGRVAADSLGIGSSTSYFEGLKSTVSDWKTQYNQFLQKYTGTSNCYTLGTYAQINACLANQGKLSLKVPVLKAAFARTQTFKDFEDVFRAYIGDYYGTLQGGASAGDGSMDVGAISKCDDVPQPLLIDALVDGDYETLQMWQSGDTFISGQCQRTSEPDKGLRTRVNTTLTSIRNKIAGSASPIFSTEELDIINISPIPIYRYLSTAAIYERVSGDTGHIFTDGNIEAMSEYIAYNIAHTILSGVSATTRSLLTAIKGEGLTVDDRKSQLAGNLIGQLDFQIAASDIRMSEKRDAFKLSVGDFHQKYVNMQNVVYQKLNESKLLNSYLWAKGQR